MPTSLQCATATRLRDPARGRPSPRSLPGSRRGGPSSKAWTPDLLHPPPVREPGMPMGFAVATGHFGRDSDVIVRRRPTDRRRSAPPSVRSADTPAVRHPIACARGADVPIRPLTNVSAPLDVTDPVSVLISRFPPVPRAGCHPGPPRWRWPRFRPMSSPAPRSRASNAAALLILVMGVQDQQRPTVAASCRL